jgi:energy-coupling factor transport system ATP-binding protein
MLSGTVKVDGTLTSSSTVAQLAAKVGMVFDDPRTQLFTATVGDELAFGPENLLVPPREITERIRRALDIAGLNEYTNYAPSELSGGQKQRLAIAAALTMADRILVLDEPVSQLDPSGARNVLSFIRKLSADKKLTVVMATDSGEEAAEYADRILALKNGKLAACDTPRRIFSDKNLLETCGIQCPQVSEFARQMTAAGKALPGFPVNITEAADLTQKYFQEIFLRWREDVERERMTIPAPVRPSESKKQKSCIQIKDLSFWYKSDKIILDNINLDITDNEFTAIIGENGSGKTTLLKNICGLLRPSKGDIFIQGKNSKQLSVAETAGEIGFIMQEIDNQLFEQTVYDEIAFSLKERAMKRAIEHSIEHSMGHSMKHSMGRAMEHFIPKESIHAKVEEALAIAGLTGKENDFPLSLGRADRVKTIFASVLVMGPKIIILDEPAAGLDLHNCRRIMDMAKGLYLNGYTIILVSHNMNIIAEYAQRIIVMNKGRVYMDGKPEDVFGQPEKLAEAGILPPQITRLSHSLHGQIPNVKDALTPGELARTLTLYQ